MERQSLPCCCFKSKPSCIGCRQKSSLDIDAALQELGLLNGVLTEEQENIRKECRLRESHSHFEQSPPLWLNPRIGNAGPISSQSLRVDIDYSKEPPLQPPNSPVSPQLPYDQFRTREGLSDTLLTRCEWDSRLLGGRRISIKGRQRVLSGPDRYCERIRDRSNWRPYRIPRPKVLNAGHCSRVRTISATLHEETDRLTPTLDSSPVAVAADALQCMFIGDGLFKSLENSESNSNFPRSRSVENLERRAMDIAATTLDNVSEKIEKLHVT